jgi:hypothetical protein
VLFPKLKNADEEETSSDFGRKIYSKTVNQRNIKREKDAQRGQKNCPKLTSANLF